MPQISPKITQAEYIDRLTGLIGQQQIQIVFLRDELQQARSELMAAAARHEQEVNGLKATVTELEAKLAITS